MWHIFPTRIRSQYLNTSRKLSLNIGKKWLENKKYLKFETKEIHPSKPTVIINKYHKVLVMSMRNNWCKTPNITMNNIKAFCSTTAIVIYFWTPHAGDGVYLVWTEYRSLTHVCWKIDKSRERDIFSKPCLSCFLLSLSFPFVAKIVRFS